eukprot:TRINITY_DN4902_c0_g1_i2.p1 TRINITY_DN4902_c0_g1~~TRINITY_DN4902_c0_g1_i2.p1  ORF type:complete len:260 (+),score=58.90 TRINITY_DN4902_c0_g1_i2:262-1041(+)
MSVYTIGSLLPKVDETVHKYTVYPPTWDKDDNVDLQRRNWWPETAAGKHLRDALEAYYSDLQRVSDALNAALSEALGQPRNFVHNALAPHTGGALRAKCYQSRTVKSDEPAMAAHKDLGTTTLLATNAPGLQFQHKGTDEWVDVQVPAGALIVNLGEFYEVWTRGAWRATPHRVLGCETDRVSLAFFSNQSIYHPADGSKPISCKVAPLDVASLGDSGKTGAEWKGLTTNTSGDERGSLQWPEFFYERLSAITIGKGGA